MSLVGIDGCRSGWIAVVVGPSGVVSAHHLYLIDDVVAIAPDAKVIAIDIPIGLPETGRRQADLAARDFLGRRRNSVFHTPVRAALEAATHAEATAASMRVTGAGISQQSFALRRKIIEVERWLPSASCPVFEVHPEVSFAVLLGAPAAAPKKTWAGMRERSRGLAAAGIDLQALDVGTAAVAASVDDMLDAAVVAWTAGRIAAGTARSFPDPPEPGPGGRALAVWA
jgi:predicted RNase H-like nuclease